jgi:excisionase family DNA binding protein
MDAIYTTEGAAKLLQCSVKTIEERLRTGDLPGEKFGDSWVLPGQALIERVNEMAKAKAAERRLVRNTPAPLVKVARPRYNARLKQAIGQILTPQ